MIEQNSSKLPTVLSKFLKLYGGELLIIDKEIGIVAIQENLNKKHAYRGFGNFVIWGQSYLLPPSGRAGTKLKRGIRADLQKFFDKCLGKGIVKVRITKIMNGSITVWAVITLVGAGLHNFIKDYKQLRENSAMIADDLKKLSASTRKRFQKYAKKKGTPKITSRSFEQRNTDTKYLPPKDKL